MSKKQPKLTPWFPAHVRPAYVGVYEKDFGRGGGHDYQYWDGQLWRYGSTTPKATMAKVARDRDMLIPSARQWRGLAEKP